MSTLVYAPTGWGWFPGSVMGGVSAEDLPDMPLLARISDPQRRNAALVDMLKDRPALLAILRPRDLVRKYGLAQATASMLLTKARNHP
ncbi:hypothetical protein [Marilutibacter spongiae]|uniref:Uncharacterized protein n=1 Tax=Marilutibacter spongiae TaxID=2025720 RepID=A0A7W3TLH3_9GAMM|nr:hypothetical protein [Lysobacter spongiae]MBB1060381.1 hypothetical protein [Lysobacter spongiae]